MTKDDALKPAIDRIRLRRAQIIAANDRESMPPWDDMQPRVQRQFLRAADALLESDGKRIAGLIDIHKIELAGAVTRSQMLLDAKDHWRDRAEKAEAALTEARHERDAERERCAKIADEATEKYMAGAGFFKINGRYQATPAKDAQDIQNKATAAAMSNASLAIASAIRSCNKEG